MGSSVGPLWANSVTPSVYMALAAAAPVVIVASALFVEYAGGAITWQPLILIGNASYAIYLTHPIVFDVMKTGNERWLQLPTPEASTMMMLCYVAIAGGAGIIVHLTIENPLLRVIGAGGNRASKHSCQAVGLMLWVDSIKPHRFCVSPDYIDRDVADLTLELIETSCLLPLVVSVRLAAKPAASTKTSIWPPPALPCRLPKILRLASPQVPVT